MCATLYAKATMWRGLPSAHNVANARPKCHMVLQVLHAMYTAVLRASAVV